MKCGISRVYSILLFVSFLSSCLLFILVASEIIKGDPLSSHYRNFSSVNGVAESAHTGDAKTQHIEEEEPLMYPKLAAVDKNIIQSDDIIQSHQKEEEVAEIHSSFEDEVLSSSSNGPSNSYIGPHVAASGVTVTNKSPLHSKDIGITGKPEDTQNLPAQKV